jgi:FkbM family methyltransferase
MIIKKATYKLFKLLNVLHRKAYRIYTPLYFLYKYISDRRTINLLNSNITEGMRAVDIGANIGFYSILLSRLVGATGFVDAFEPDHHNFALLKSNTRYLNNIAIHNVACGSRSGTAKLYISNDMNTDHHTYEGDGGRGYVEVDCLALDDYFSSMEIEAIDFIKIDIQGYDYYAIEGMKKIIFRSGHIMIHGEFWPYGLDKAGIEPREYLRLLENMGFDVSFASSLIYCPRTQQRYDYHFYTDFWAIRK